MRGCPSAGTPAVWSRGLSRASKLVVLLDQLVTDGIIVSFVMVSEARWMILLNDGENLYYNNKEALAFTKGASAS